TRDAAHSPLCCCRDSSNHRTSRPAGSDHNRSFAAPPWRSLRVMYFPISHSHINPIYLVVTGFVIGLLGGFFGVGGSFIAGPALRLMGVDWNYAVGTDLAHIVGKSIVAARKHRTLGNVDLKLG